MTQEMNETEKVEKEIEQQNSETNNNDGSITETTPLIRSANLAAERLEKANQKYEEIALRLEAIEAQVALGGRSDAGSAEPEKPKEVSPKEYATKFLKGDLNE